LILNDAAGRRDLDLNTEFTEFFTEDTERMDATCFLSAFPDQLATLERILSSSSRINGTLARRLQHESGMTLPFNL
jgi:hypothetical protein